MLYCHSFLSLIKMKWLATEQHVIVRFVALMYIFKQITPIDHFAQEYKIATEVILFGNL